MWKNHRVREEAIRAAIAIIRATKNIWLGTLNRCLPQKTGPPDDHLAQNNTRLGGAGNLWITRNRPVAGCWRTTTPRASSLTQLPERNQQTCLDGLINWPSCRRCTYDVRRIGWLPAKVRAERAKKISPVVVCGGAFRILSANVNHMGRPRGMADARRC